MIAVPHTPAAPGAPNKGYGKALDTQLQHSCTPALGLTHVHAEDAKQFGLRALWVVATSPQAVVKTLVQA